MEKVSQQRIRGILRSADMGVDGARRPSKAELAEKRRIA